MSSIVLFIFILPIVLMCNGCSANRQASVSFYAMDTIMQITCYGKDAEAVASAAQAEIMRLDELLSIGNGNSEVSLINKNGGGILSEDVAALAEYALMLYRMTDGAYDMTILPVMELWGFTSGDYSVPDDETLKNMLELCNSGLIRYMQVSDNTTAENSGAILSENNIDGNVENDNNADDTSIYAGKYRLILSDGQGIDFGGLAKGYASDRLVDIFDSYNIKSAYFSLGGNVYCYHRKTDGSDWNIAIENPLKNFAYYRGDDVGGEGAGTGEGAKKISEDVPDYLGAVRVHDKAVVTSGGYERYFEQDGKRYHHIIDTATGYPAESGLISVTVVSGDGALADGLSTACFVMGLDDSVSLWRAYGAGGTFEGRTIAPFDLIVMTDDGEVYVTQGIVQNFSSGYDVHVVEKEDKK